MKNVELSHAPEAWIDRIWRVVRGFGADEGVLSEVPNRAAFLISDDDRVWQCGYPAATRALKIRSVVKRKTEKAVDELGSVERHGLEPIAPCDPIVLPSEGDARL